MQIDAIIKPKKANRQRRRGKNDEDMLDRAADEEVSRLRELMLAAAAEDMESNRDKMPATKKLRTLSQVMAVLRKYVCIHFRHSRLTTHKSKPQSLILLVLSVHHRQ